MSNYGLQGRKDVALSLSNMLYPLEPKKGNNQEIKQSDKSGVSDPEMFLQKIEHPGSNSIETRRIKLLKPAN